MYSRQDMSMIVLWGGMLWVGSLILGVLLPSQMLLRYWKELSEILWLVLGIDFVRRSGVWVVSSVWSLVIGRFMVISLGVIIVWWLLLAVVGLLLGDESAGAIVGLTRSLAEAARVHGGYVQELLLWMREALRLLIVGLIPIFLYKSYYVFLKKN